jgi:hypothetical protein
MLLLAAEEQETTAVVVVVREDIVPMFLVKLLVDKLQQNLQKL